MMMFGALSFSSRTVTCGRELRVRCTCGIFDFDVVSVMCLEGFYFVMFVNL